MLLTSLYLKQFRKISEATFQFSPGVNALVGPNARGKTTVLEAIHFLICGQSFRTHKSQELYQIGTHRFDLACEFEKEGSISRLSVSVDPQNRQMLFRDTRYNSLTPLLGLLMGSVITPDDTNLIKGSPQIRRGFIDLQIAEVDPLYLWHLSRYNRAMRQRNALLKAKKLVTCESWEHEMAVSACYINRARREAAALLESHFQRVYQRLQDSDEKVAISLIASGQSLEQNENELFFKKEYARLRERETYLGFTLIGPHKDDLEIMIQDKPAKIFASEGQKQTLLVALKIAEWKRLAEISQEMPLFMIDDVGISLDKTRRKRLYQELGQMGQVFLTSTDPIEADLPINHLSMI